MSKGTKFLSDLKLHTDYLKYVDELERYETWDEACEAVLNTHRMKYGDKVNDYIEEIIDSYKNREFLASQRNLQYRGEQILQHNTRMYNCCVGYAYSPDFFGKALYIALSGTGLGANLRRKYVSRLPHINIRTKGTKTYVIEDSIEGWGRAVHTLMSSYCEHPSLDNEFFGYEIKFDYSKIRPLGSYISGGFKAPGHEGLKQSLERIEELYNTYLGHYISKPFKSIVAYDTLMHISDAVLSGGVRRSAMNILLDLEDIELLNAKIGDWRKTHPWRARSNNSVALVKGEFTKEEFESLLALNSGDNDIGFALLNHEDEMYNPCFEIGFNFYNQIKDYNHSVFQFCNLNEISASACVYKTSGNFSKEKFYELCRKAAILGTLQAGYTDFPELGKETEEIVEGEALLGVSITGWMTRPELFDPEILKEGARIVKETNKEVAEFLGINQAARTTTVKPSGNAAVILETESGIHAAHSRRGFRLMQLNKESETGKYLKKHVPFIIEDSSWSATNSDYIVFSTYEHSDETILKNEMQGVKHLELISLVQKNWVMEGKNEDLCYNKDVTHNVSNTVIVDDMGEISDYIYNNQEYFAAVSFISLYGDKDYNQAPFTSVYNSEELLEMYGDSVLFMSGLIVDGLHYFNNNLWTATDYIKDNNLDVGGTYEQSLLRKDWIRRVKKFAKNYFNDDIQKTIYCMKDVHLWHKFTNINRDFKSVDFTKILTKPEYHEVQKFASISCSGGSCEII